ncbi:MAG: DUF2336 domain-containing protein [Pseudomonadota bacterium]
MNWKETADVAKRSAAASALARAYLVSDMSFEERCAADAALTDLVDDPSPRVRLSLAEALATSPHAPEQILVALLADRFDIASLIVVRSPRIRETDLVDRVRSGDPRLQSLIAQRPQVGRMLALALARYAGPDAAAALIENRNARICAECRRILVDRFAQEEQVRAALLELPDLEPLLRYHLLVAVNRALSENAFVAELLGAGRAKVTSEAALQPAINRLLSSVHGADCEQLVDALRADGQLTTALIMRAACHGHLDFVGAVVADLSGLARDMVIDALASAREGQLHGVFAKAKLGEKVAEVLTVAVRQWRAVSQGRSQSGAQEITYTIIEAMTSSAKAHDYANDDIEGLLRSIYLDEVRNNARSHARAVATANAA